MFYYNILTFKQNTVPTAEDDVCYELTRLKTIFFRRRSSWYCADLKLRGQEGGFFFFSQLVQGSVGAGGVHLSDGLRWLAKQPPTSCGHH